MAKGIYVGVDSKARKVTKAYVGVAEDSLVVNGDFSNGLDTNYWSAQIAALSIEQGSLKTVFTSNTSSENFVLVYYYLGNNVTAINGHKYYYSFKIQIPNTTVGTFFTTLLGQTSIFFDNIPKDNSWHGLSGVMEATKAGSGDSYRRLALNIKAPAKDDIIWFDDIKFYDLTEMFGEGEEPTSEWCDANLEALKNLYNSKNEARKIKKGYIGVAGIARPFFSSDPEVSYYGTVTDLSARRRQLSATTVGNYAIFAGGWDGSSNFATVDTYTTSLVKGTATDLSVARRELAATTVGNYALFGGGYDGSSAYYTTVDTYTSSLVKGTATGLRTARYMLSATTVGNYAVFGGGRADSSASAVDAYNSSLSRSTATNLSKGRFQLSATTVGDYALFTGGRDSNGTCHATVDTYTSSLVKGTATDLSAGRRQLAATSVGDYALFAGGYTGSVYSATVDTYTSSLVKGTATDLSVARLGLSATTVGDYALFAGGCMGSTYYATVDTYTSSLVKDTATNLSEGRYYLSATSVGDYALFGGGWTSGTNYFATVDAYQVI